ncbi:MAG: CHAT domain-containing protein, partial [Acidobacteriota bacterium]
DDGPAELYGNGEQLASIRGSLAELDGRIDVHVLRGKEATRAAVEQALRHERYDLFHFCGHGFLQIENKGTPGESERSGIMLAGVDFLDFLHFRDLDGAPRALILNTCHAHTRFLDDDHVPDPADLRYFPPRTFAEKILKSGTGVEAFVGTRWRLHFQSAGAFASAAYRTLADGGTLADGVISGRQALVNHPVRGRETDWANYQLYGDGRLRLVPA